MRFAQLKPKSINFKAIKNCTFNRAYSLCDYVCYAGIEKE